MGINGKSLLYSLAFYTITIFILLLVKFHTIKINNNKSEPLTIDYIGSYNMGENIPKKDSSLLSKNNTNTNTIKSSINPKKISISTEMLKEQNLLAKEFSQKLPSTNHPTENTVQVINEKALYRKVTNNPSKQNSNTPNSLMPSTNNTATENKNTNTNANSSNFNLEGRILLTAPTISDKSSQTGIVAVAITVNNNGDVIDAKAGVEGTTIPAVELWKKCERASLQAKYNSIKSSIAYQTGIIRFRFITY